MALLELRDVTKTFSVRGRTVHALRGVDLDLDTARTLALVGESGSGKSTLGRVVAGLHGATSGTATFGGFDLLGSWDRERRRSVQMVFQHPYQSLDPRWTVDRILREPLARLSGTRGAAAGTRVAELLDLVGLPATMRTRLPGELSGGQQQRVAIARALAPAPDLVVLDEPTSGLDQSVRGRVVALLRDLQQSTQAAYLFITHDISVVRQIADEVVVMHQGLVVERGGTAAVLDTPREDYTRALLAAVPVADPRRRARRLPGSTSGPGTTPAPATPHDEEIAR
ncbi:ABC transporter ATP-binding protein [Cellulomonas triticagri]|uniref:ABC transporter ATP-binding protein n=1 Tax=Cellulomonas triticagri TaxID=2483352 RepID=UPI001F290A59|nr:ATP-binding cassette domain-containing protein [Cellulomonas triticagri]